ncbi:MAG: tRNA uridine-5-carboxymethylaminomethyl(34) synthesis enzyme MnmG [Deltaproteobacteria bacterium]|nr:tRNA uridine-5-carboxymethylaminomethyl(34) synthesis enzyme MnmG [Deltaproteobacteria bacterium]
MNDFDIIVVGGGHAGMEAASSCAKLGARTCLVTLDENRLGDMPCNPAVGGIAKGHLVKEIDALGGIMGKITDTAAIQYRRLNTRRGPAVRATRAQVDRHMYVRNMVNFAASLKNLTVIRGEVTKILTENSIFSGVELGDGVKIHAVLGVVTTGTYLNGILHTGSDITPGGAAGMPQSTTLSSSLKFLGATITRLKTGTPPRLAASSINFDAMEIQPGDETVRKFSFYGPENSLPKIDCYMTWTNEKTHELITDGFEIAPLFNGQIHGTGPRYCPSIEDKVFKFPQRPRHHLFLEPEGLDTDWYYPNGVSTSLPVSLQLSFLRSIKGLENAEIRRPGYAVEYDSADSRDLYRTMETKYCPNLFLAGQLNGTSGYEEAAAQGLLAGINAFLKLRNMEPFIVERYEGYMGVMADDLVTRGTDEPYRLFTSRSEYRLSLREDNADERFTPYGREIGLIDDNAWRIFSEAQELLAREKLSLSTIKIPKNAMEDVCEILNVSNPDRGMTVSELLKRPEIAYSDLIKNGIIDSSLPQHLGERLESIIKYEGYLSHQEKEIGRLRKVKSVKIPKDFDYSAVSGLRVEWIQKLEKVKPENLAEVLAIPGLAVAAITAITAHMRNISIKPVEN